MQTSETDSLVVAVEEDVKNDEVAQVEELLESEKLKIRVRNFCQTP